MNFYVTVISTSSTAVHMSLLCWGSEAEGYLVLKNIFTLNLNFEKIWSRIQPSGLGTRDSGLLFGPQFVTPAAQSGVRDAWIVGYIMAKIDRKRWVQG